MLEIIASNGPIVMHLREIDIVSDSGRVCTKLAWLRADGKPITSGGYHKSARQKALKEVKELGFTISTNEKLGEVGTMKKYLYIARGYSYGKGRNYVILTVAEGSSKAKAWWHGSMQVLYRSGKLFMGSTSRSAARQKIEFLKKKYPCLIVD